MIWALSTPAMVMLVVAILLATAGVLLLSGEFYWPGSVVLGAAFLLMMKALI